MNVLIACEFSGIVREAFKRKGHNAYSCDLISSEIKGKHYKGYVENLFDLYKEEFNLMIAHPPCTHLSVSGARWFKDKIHEQELALNFVKYLMNVPVEKICIENPISIISTKIRKPDQIIQPWMFGHGETKSTCLWLKGLLKLTPTNIVEGREAKVHKMPPSPDRWKNRSRTYQGIADAMADQWG
jgi:site-specific DNA-cytosine methylase